MTGRVFILLLALAMGSVRIGLACPPPVMLWAWERPHDLSCLYPRVAGVAYPAEFEYRFNRRYDLAAMLPRLGWAAVRIPPMPYRLFKLTEPHA